MLPREQFLEVTAQVRPDLHRYCTRMVGSVGDAEDVVQDTLASAYLALPELESMASLRGWLFQIAHHRALDFLRRYDRRMRQPFELVEDTAVAMDDPPDEALAHREAVGHALSAFMELNPSQRSCVILKDVLGSSVDEIAALLELNVPAVKALLHRGRAHLRATRPEVRPRAPHAPELLRYISLFNARDWDGVRAMLAADVRLDLVARLKRSGREVSSYVSNYESRVDWFFVPAWLDGAPVIAVYRDRADPRPGYFIEIGLDAGAVVSIRDFRYVPYIAVDAPLEITTWR